MLKAASYTDIDCVHSGGSALAALRQKKYDLVITDWQMQPISGVELTKLIRAKSRRRALYSRSASPVEVLLVRKAWA
jgi:two-component system, chemotaxis family, chemotaxis protein CheY